ncbi:hypothetical protein JET14_15600 [Martelella lutilitoris]|uniref:Uncharacterized protein n=1 Tax=Martelella lutilitoris TaxID=2583532 RepID=A0A7T7HIE9_9HYPH|nr:hypothetical protein [Martelella lutilitoris]QQM29712.1 hypothetical protein JET14_15600 [Martelella lutilitoris]
MTDRFSSRNATPTSPAYDGFEITPDDAVPLEEVTRAIYVGIGGSMTATLISGETVTFENLPSGFVLPVRISHVLVTGTTAGALVGLV